MSLFQPMNDPIANWQGQTVWLIGASSGIGQATAHALHAQGAAVVVSARSAAALNAFVDAHPGAVALPLDVSDAASVHQAAQTVFATGRLDRVLICAGTYSAMRATDYSLARMLDHQRVNYVGALHVLDAVLPYFLARRGGHISVVASVAGYRGLPQSLAYGPTKAALINLAETLYLDLQGSGVGVSLVCPGFVETPLTAQNKFNMPGLIKPDQAARQILRGWARGQFEIHFPRRFTWLMKCLACLPARLYFLLIHRLTGL